MEQKRIMIQNSLHRSQEFVVNEHEDHIEIGWLLSGELEKVEIPEIIDGKTVTVIGEGCFFNCGDHSGQVKKSSYGYVIQGLQFSK